MFSLIPMQDCYKNKIVLLSKVHWLEQAESYYPLPWEKSNEKINKKTPLFNKK